MDGLGRCQHVSRWIGATGDASRRTTLSRPRSPAWLRRRHAAICQEHELAHHLIAEHFGSHSLVLFALAHGETVAPAFAAAEESLAMNLQRYVRTNEHPFVDRVDWHALRARFLEMADG
jgi:hypothetical protein